MFNATFCVFQEDVPDEFASHVLNFISRNRIGPHGVEVLLNTFLSFVHFMVEAKER